MYYIYKTTNNINNKIYIGMHKSINIETDNYIGSGTAFLRAVDKYGRSNFTREILFEFETFEEALIKESILVNDDFVKRRDTYNLTNGGKGMEHISGHNSDKICVYSPESGKNYYVHKENIDEFIEKGWLLGNNTKGRICISKDTIIKYCNIDELDYYLSDGWYKSSSTNNKICVSNIETNKLKYIDPSELNEYLCNGYSIGNKKSGVNKGTIYINKDSKNKRINTNELDLYLNDGWVKGFIQREFISKRMYNPITNELKNIEIHLLKEYEEKGWLYGNNHTPNKNKIYITKNKKNKRVDIKELDVYLSDGWIKGMYNKKYDKSLKNE